LGNVEAAYAAVDAASALAPNNPVVRLERIRQAFLDDRAPKERLVAAIRDLSELQETRPNDPLVRQLSGVYAARTGHPDEGIALVRAAHEAIDSGDSALVASDTLWALGKREEALELIDFWVRAHPGDNRARLRRAAYLLALTRFTEAAVDLEDAVAGGAERPDLQPMLAWTLVQAGQVDRAAKAARLAYEGNPDDPIALQAMAMVRLDEGDVSGAVSMLSEAMRTSPRPDTTLQLDYAEALAANKEVAKARALLDKVIADPGVPSVFKNRAHRLMLQGSR
jgi:predicted Zn-dependent protease